MNWPKFFFVLLILTVFVIIPPRSFATGVEHGSLSQRFRIVKITPSKVNVIGQPGLAVFKTMTFENQSGKPVDISVYITDQYPGYLYSVLANTSVELVRGNKIRLRPHQTVCNPMKLYFHKSATFQVKYGAIKIKVYSVERDPELLEDVTLLLSAAIT